MNKIYPHYEISELSLYNFRSFFNYKLTPKAGINVIFGPNGSGKTNILEAISMLGASKGLRSALITDIKNKDANDIWAVTATVNDCVQDVKVAVGVDSRTGKKVNRINGENTRQIDLAFFFHSIWLTPQQDRLFLGAASDRRKFIDQIVFAVDNAHAGRILAYEKAMRERIALLNSEQTYDLSWLQHLEKVMAQKAMAITSARHSVIAGLQGYMDDSDELFPSAVLSFSSDIDDIVKEQNALDAEESYLQQLQMFRQKDGIVGKTHIGPHRSDLCVVHKQKQTSARLCSTGEQKALLISIFLSNIKMLATQKGILPVILLDEAVAHMDNVRRKIFFEKLISTKAQVFLTGTDKTLFNDLDDITTNWINMGKPAEQN